jgi:hypothetical protein
MDTSGSESSTLIAIRPRLPASIDAGEAPAWIGTERDFRWLENIVKALLVLNLADAILTMLWISEGRATEANPFLRDLAHQDPVAFVCVKTALVSLGAWLLWRHRDRPLSVVATFVAFLTYFFLLLYHLSSMHLHLLARLSGL